MAGGGRRGVRGGGHVPPCGGPCDIGNMGGRWWCSFGVFLAGAVGPRGGAGIGGIGGGGCCWFGLPCGLSMWTALCYPARSWWDAACAVAQARFFRWLVWRRLARRGGVVVRCGGWRCGVCGGWLGGAASWDGLVDGVEVPRAMCGIAVGRRCGFQLPHRSVRRLRGRCTGSLCARWRNRLAAASEGSQRRLTAADRRRVMTLGGAMAPLSCTGTAA